MDSIEKRIEKATNQYIDENLKEVIEWNALSQEQIVHIKNIAKNIVFARENILNGSGFVMAVMDNNLESAISNADSVCVRALKLFILVKLWVRF